MCDDGGEVDGAGGPLARRSPTSCRGEEAVIDQAIGTDQQRVAGKRGETLIGGVAVAGRPKRQHLPDPLLARSEEIDELERGRTEVADPIAARQRGRMKQDAARAPERHG